MIRMAACSICNNFLCTLNGCTVLFVIIPQTAGAVITKLLRPYICNWPFRIYHWVSGAYSSSDEFYSMWEGTMFWCFLALGPFHLWLGKLIPVCTCIYKCKKPKKLSWYYWTWKSGQILLNSLIWTHVPANYFSVAVIKRHKNDEVKKFAGDKYNQHMFRIIDKFFDNFMIRFCRNRTLVLGKVHLGVFCSFFFIRKPQLGHYIFSVAAATSTAILIISVSCVWTCIWKYVCATCLYNPPTSRCYVLEKCTYTYSKLTVCADESHTAIKMLSLNYEVLNCCSVW